MSKLPHRLSDTLKKIVRHTTSIISTPANYQDKYQNHFLKYADLNSKSLLIVGLGRGLEVPLFLEKGCAKIVAVEPYPIVEASQFGSKFELLVAGSEAMPIEDNSFDYVYSIASLEHMANPFAAVSEMSRTLKPKGILYCSGGPFWYSAFGYHKKSKYPLLTEPWFHIAYEKADYLDKHPEIKQDTQHLKRINQIYEHPGYNRLSAQTYYDIMVELLTNSLPLEIDINTHPKTMLNRSSYKELLIEKYSEKDLLTEGFTFVVKKTG